MANRTLEPRQSQFRTLFNRELKAVKAEFGHGQYSYTEGVNRNAARRIARNRARTKFRLVRLRGIDLHSER